MVVLANDPSIRAWGWAVLQIKNGRSRILATGCIKTQNETKKRRIRASDDMTRRLEEIAKELVNVQVRYSADWILCEAPHGSQSASAAKMIGAVAGLMTAHAICHRLPINWFSEGDCKKHLLGKRSASKEETINSVAKIYGSAWRRNIKYKDEAVADALAVFHMGRENCQSLIYALNND